MTFRSRPVHIYHTLVAAASELQCQITLSLYERAVHQDIRHIQKLFHRVAFCGHVSKLLICISAERRYVQSAFFDALRQLQESFRLTERLAS